MKIVLVSNFDNEMVDDILVCENINKEEGKERVNHLNNYIDEHSTYYYVLQEDSYKLYKFEP